MAYLGALAPDITNFQKGPFKRKTAATSRSHTPRVSSRLGDPDEWATLFHTNRSGDLLLTLLEQIAEVPSPAVRSQALAFCLGYLSHIAADIAINPWINALASQYRRKDIPGMLLPLNMHFYTELCLDEYTATTFFQNQLYQLLIQPWNYYVEPAAHNMLTTSTDLSARVLDLFVSATETTYALNEQQVLAFRRHYLAGLQQLRLYLAGRGSFRWLILNARTRRSLADPIAATIAANQHQRGATSCEEAVTYAIHLSEQFCRRAISYYASLRNTRATAVAESFTLAVAAALATPVAVV